MMFPLTLLILIGLILSASTVRKKDKYVSGDNTDQKEALKFLQDYNDNLLKVTNKFVVANWNYQTNLTEANRIALLNISQGDEDLEEDTWKKARSFAWKEFKDTNKTAYRMFKVLSLGGDDPPKEKLRELGQIKTHMLEIFSKAKVCAYRAPSGEQCRLSLEPELTEILMKSRSYGELTHVWSQWRDVTGKKMRNKFIRYIELSNEVAKLYGYSDMGETWREIYDSEDFVEDVEDLWQTLKPLYEQLHAYVRRKLREQYPFSGIKADGPIPAHLLGNLWGETWINIFDLVAPYPIKSSTDVTEAMKKKNMTPIDMFKMAEEFYTSLGLKKMTPEFWHRSIFEKPTDRDIVCHATAWDFKHGDDFRIKMCTEVNLENLLAIHHEMGHIEYFMEYAKQPALFRDAANPGFHEAIGDAIALSAATPKHLEKIGLLEEVLDDEETGINTLLQTALDTIAFLPFGYLIDAWRWKVFDGSIREEELNQKWWEMRLQYQGLCPPVKRTEEDLDAGSKYHVAASMPYIRYFVSIVIQFQFHKSLCDVAGHQGPLHKCDIYNSKRAGQLLSDVLSKGSSEHWEEIMSIATGGKTRKMDATAIIEYFTPLLDWLKEQNKNELLGWKSSDPLICP